MDARARRSRDRLSTAVLTLAAHRDAGSVSVAELAREAGVHRSTVYEHADSPADLLRTVLRDELDLVRQQHLVDVPADGIPAAIRAVTLGVLEHVDTHRAVYALALGSADDAALHVMLSSHFRESVLLLVEAGAVTVPSEIADPEVLARFVADGTVGAIDAWLRGSDADAPRDPDHFVRAYRALMPAWWPLG
ncbi:MAG: TetR/AcrR family transcriptional regulator C-terminal domain-containing protein [Microbacteriaceae bacterium]